MEFLLNRVRCKSFNSETCKPFRRISPDSGLSNKPSKYIRVLLPHPDGPTIEVSSPLFNSKDTPLSAFTFFPPVVNVCFRFLTVKILDTIR